MHEGEQRLQRKRRGGVVPLALAVGVAGISTAAYLRVSSSEESKKAVVTKTRSIIDHGDRKSNKVALTFDADMTPSMKRRLKNGEVPSWYNGDLIDVLEKHTTPATLFLTGMWAEVYPDTTKKLSENPLFEIGNHSYDHAAFTGSCYGLDSIPNSENKTNIAKSQESISSITDTKPTLFRFPGLCHDKEDVKAVNSAKMVVVDGDVPAADGFNKNTKGIVTKVLNEVQGGSIVVAHMHGGPNAPKTDEAMDQIIPKLREKGYTLVTVSELMKK